jgi:hypothetical protein
MREAQLEIFDAGEPSREKGAAGRGEDSKKLAVDWRAVGRRLRELRGFDTTQVDLARELGISQAQLSR